MVKSVKILLGVVGRKGYLYIHIYISNIEKLGELRKGFCALLVAKNFSKLLKILNFLSKKILKNLSKKTLKKIYCIKKKLYLYILIQYHTYSTAVLPLLLVVSRIGATYGKCANVC